MNLHIIEGRLTADPELIKGSEPAKDRVKFTVASDRKYGDETDFFDCTVFGKLAEILEKYGYKGREILISGEGQFHPYEGKDGVKRKPYQIVVRDLKMHGAKKDSADPASSVPDGYEEVTEEIPF